MSFFHDRVPRCYVLFQDFVRPFQTENKIIGRLLNHRRSFQRRATDLDLNDGLPAFPNQARQGRLPKQWPPITAPICSFAKICTGIRSTTYAPISYRMLSRPLGAAPMKPIAKRVSHSAWQLGTSYQILQSGEPKLRRLFYLPSNAPMSGAEVRSTKASAPLAG